MIRSQILPSRFQSIPVQVPSDDKGHGLVSGQSMGELSAGCCLESSQTHALDNHVPFILPDRSRLSVAELLWRGRLVDTRHASYT